MWIAKLIALLFAFAAVAATLLQPSDVRVQGLKPTAGDQEDAEPSTSKAAAGAGGGFPPLPGMPLPQIPGFQLPQIPGLPPLLSFLFPLLPLLPGALGAPPSPESPGLPHLPPIPGLPTTPPSQPQPSPGLPMLPPMLGLPGLPGSSPPPPPPPKECLTPLMSMMPCMDYLTNITVLAPPSTCCDGLKWVIDAAPICLCHAMNGGMSKLVPQHIDPIHMLILPLGCGTMLPLQTFFACSRLHTTIAAIDGSYLSTGDRSYFSRVTTTYRFITVVARCI